MSRKIKLIKETGISVDAWSHHAITEYRCRYGWMERVTEWMAGD